MRQMGSLNVKGYIDWLTTYLVKYIAPTVMETFLQRRLKADLLVSLLCLLKDTSINVDCISFHAYYTFVSLGPESEFEISKLPVVEWSFQLGRKPLAARPHLA